MFLKKALKKGKSFSFFKRTKSSNRLEKNDISKSLVFLAEKTEPPLVLLSEFKVMELPRDVFITVLELLPAPDLFRLSRVSTYWRDCSTLFITLRNLHSVRNSRIWDYKSAQLACTQVSACTFSSYELVRNHYLGRSLTLQTFEQLRSTSSYGDGR